MASPAVFPCASSLREEDIAIRPAELALNCVGRGREIRRACYPIRSQTRPSRHPLRLPRPMRCRPFASPKVDARCEPCEVDVAGPIDRRRRRSRPCPSRSGNQTGPPQAHSRLQQTTRRFRRRRVARRRPILPSTRPSGRVSTRGAQAGRSQVRPLLAPARKQPPASPDRWASH